MRQPQALLVLLAVTAVASADPKTVTKLQDPATTYLAAVEKSADALAGVTDAKTAAEAKAKLENYHEEAAEARALLFRSLADGNLTDRDIGTALGRVTERLQEANKRTGKAFARIATEHKAAYKVLRDTKLFAELEKEFDDRAAREAKTLVGSVALYADMHDGKRPKVLSELAKTDDDARKYLLDPWGFPFQLKYAGDDRRAYVWTVNPYTGEKLGQPPPDEKK